jgi:hypothetical protein
VIGKALALRRRELVRAGVLALAAAWLSAGIVGGQESRRFDLALKGGELPREQRTLRVKQNESVELRWSSDKPIVLHLHGYDIELAVKPDEPAAMAFVAKIAGRFALSSVTDPGKSRAAHTHGPRVLYLEVHP